MKFQIRGMDCAEEVAVLKREVGPLVGGEANLSFDILNGVMTVQAKAFILPNDVIAAVERTGMHAEPWSEAREIPAGGFWSRHRRIFLTAASGSLAAAGFIAHSTLAGGFSNALGLDAPGHEQAPPILAQVLYALSILAGAWQVLPKAWLALRRLRPDMNALMTFAVIGAVCIGEWFEAATVAFLFAVSLLLESWSVDRARKAVAALMKLSPEFARVKSANGQEKNVAPEQVEIGAKVVVRPGDKVPLDGRVVEGSSAVNQAPITGESAPVPKAPGDPVFAGSINGDGLIVIETTKSAQDTTLARIIRMVGEAQSRRAPSEQWVEKFARFYTPIVLALAVLIAVAPPVFLGQSWSEWIYRGLVLLVIGCPCALVISTPVSIVAAMAAAARNGVLVKGGVYIEAPANIKALAFDKTGTLTQGKPTVIEVIPLSGHSERELLERVAAIEANANHPLAHAIVAHAMAKGVPAVPGSDFQIIQGKGASARFNGRSFWLGSHRYLEERGQETPDVHDRLEAMTRAGQTVVVVGNETHVCGLIAAADTVRPEAKAAIESLRALGLTHLVMLTGDNQGTAEAIAKDSGIDAFQAELLPEDKVKAVEALVEKYGHVAMVGDGINDAPALGRASIGIAMGAAGSDAAIETADIALMSDDLSKLPWLVGHSRRTLSIIRQNISAALGIKAIFVILTLLGMSSLWLAIAADMGVSLLVVFNGLRLLNVAGVE
ncbi:MAG: heavy metal translocating P-type ATPase [Planctomycetota bacterium]|nr:heavy metal translocating P-type ATPase [Planctomycetota bacterium]